MRVDRDAVAADADPGLVDVAVRLAVRGRDRLLHVDPVQVRGARELVREGDVHVAVGRLGELGELGGLRRAHRDDLRVEHARVEARCAVRRGLPDPADQLRVGGQVVEDGTGEEPFGGEGDEEATVGDQARRSLEGGREPAPRVADRERRLEDHRAPGVDAGRDRGDRGIHGPVVGPLVLIQDDGDDEDDHVRLARGQRGVERGPQPALRVHPSDQLGEAGLAADVRPAGVDGRDHLGIDVHRDHAPAVRGELRRERQAHLPGADHRDGARRPILARPGVDRLRRGVEALVWRDVDRPAQHR